MISYLVSVDQYKIYSNCKSGYLYVGEIYFSYLVSLNSYKIYVYFFVYGNKIYNFSVVNYEFMYLILFILFDYI